MFGLAALLSLISQVSGTPYIPGGDSPAGTDCSGLASWVANVASGRPAFGSRFNTGNMEPALLARGFQYGSAPDSVVIGWDGGHAAVTLPDGTPVSSGESNSGVRVGGGGAYQSRFTHHMYLPVQAQEMVDPAAPAAAEPPAEVAPLPDGQVTEPVGAPLPEEAPPPQDAPLPESAPLPPVDVPIPADAPAPDQAPTVVEVLPSGELPPLPDPAALPPI